MGGGGMLDGGGGVVVEQNDCERGGSKHLFIRKAFDYYFLHNFFKEMLYLSKFW